MTLGLQGQLTNHSAMAASATANTVADSKVLFLYSKNFLDQKQKKVIKLNSEYGMQFICE